MKTITIKWSTDDILYIAERFEIELTEQEANSILEKMEYYHDAEIGINWGVIESYIQDFNEDKKLNN